jgi:fimbrial chaperone protein
MWQPLLTQLLSLQSSEARSVAELDCPERTGSMFGPFRVFFQQKTQRGCTKAVPTFRRTVFISLLACAAVSRLCAGPFHLSPIRIAFTDQKPTATLQITNEGDDPVTVQVHALNWQAKETGDMYSDTDEILVNPPVARIAGHGTQIIRLALRHPTRVPVERTWRLIIEQVPPPPKAGEVHMVLKASIPIFLTAHGSQFSPRLTWEAAHMPDGSFKVTASNSGNAHIQIKTMSLLVDGTGAPINSTLMGYILPGGKHEWNFQDERLKSATRITLDAQTDSESLGKLHEEITPHSSQ